MQNNLNDLFNQEINIDTLRDYLCWKFNNIPLHIEGNPNQLGRLYRLIDKEKYSKIADINNLMNTTDGLRKQFHDDPVEMFSGSGKPSAVNEAAISLAIADKIFRNGSFIPLPWRKRIEEMISSNSIE